jgi:hypothetical protein
MAQPITMVALDIAGTSIDEGGAVYVALRSAVESHTGEIDAVESDFTDRLLEAYRRRRT